MSEDKKVAETAEKPAQAKKEDPPKPQRKQVGVIMFANGEVPRGGSYSQTSDRDALVAEAKTAGYIVEVHADRADLFDPPKDAK